MAKKAGKPRKQERKKASLGHFDHDEFLARLGRRIKHLRLTKGFKSSEHFAYDIEISRVGMSRYETGTFDDIRLRTLLKIIDGLGMKPAEFFGEGF
jgi:transcriptional regulator with XRE-family HTH domain